MKEIANLAKIVTLRRATGRPLLNFDSGQAGKEEKLMQALIQAPDITALQLTKQLYGTNSVGNRTALRQLRGRVQSKLLNHLYFLDHSDLRLLVSRRYELECLDLLHKVTVLYMEGEYVLSEKLLRRCLRLAEQGDFTVYAEQATTRLLSLYAEQRKRPQYLATQRQLLALRQRLTDEREAELLLSEVISSQTDRVASRRALLPKMAGYLARAEALHRQTATYGTFIAMYRIQLAQAELQGNYARIIYLTAEATEQLRLEKLNAYRFDQRYNLFMSLYAHLRSRQAVAGLKIAEELDQKIHPTSSNWFYFYEHYLLLALHAGEFELAPGLLHAVQHNPSFSKLRPAALERWTLLEAYTELVQPPDKLPMRRRARLATFAALTVPEYSRDKRGHNVAILVFQLLHYLRQRELEPVLTRLERLYKYQLRHLRDAATLRSRTFVRLLQLVPEADFDVSKLMARSHKLLDVLHEAPIVGDAGAETEIIPYESLWALVLQVLSEGKPTR